MPASFSYKDTAISNNVIYYMYLITQSKFKGNIDTLFKYEYELHDCGINVTCIFTLYLPRVYRMNFIN